MDTKLYYHFLKDARELRQKVENQNSGWGTADYRPPLGENPLSGEDGLPMQAPGNLMAEAEHPEE